VQRVLAQAEPWGFLKLRAKDLSWGMLRSASARIIEYYESQTDDQALAEQKHALEKQKETLVDVPVELLPFVRELIAKFRESRESRD